jgi:pimeloyl-ACP methyl ester carboxylesterase
MWRFKSSPPHQHMNRLYIIYIPGIGDARPSSYQAKAVRTWSWWGVEAEIFELNWADDVPWQTKFQSLLNRIDELGSAGRKVSLVGVSAGASAAINAYAERPAIHGVVLIAGKVNRPAAIGRRYRQNEPSFVTSAEHAPDSLGKLSPADRRRILSRFAVLDGVVTRKDSTIPDARNRISPTIGHVLTIAVQITLGAPSFIRFLERLPVKD